MSANGTSEAWTDRVRIRSGFWQCPQWLGLPAQELYDLVTSTLEETRASN